MSTQIISNNPTVKEEFQNVVFVEGGFLDVLIKVRDLVYTGHELINHPLGASIRIMFSPYRSIMVGDKTTSNNQYFMETIENSIINYKKHMEVRLVDNDNNEDYRYIDKDLLMSAIREHEMIKNLN
ncbi:MAG: GrdX family protein [Gudongella sp.]|nr:GrdX family protein [Gudongella sp.]